MTTDLAPIVDADTVARVLLHGDLKQLTPSQKISYYRAVCESVGLNPLTQPFAYINLNGKEILYALKGATDQLRQVHHVAITIAAREVVEDTYIVTARASLPDGRTDESIGAVPLGGLKGENRANAMMKAETKAKRRVTLSMVGLGMLDESEVESLPMGALAPSPRAAVGSPSPPARSVPAAATEENRGTPYTEPVTDQVTLDPGQQDDLPTGYVRLVAIDSQPTKNASVTKYSITLSTGEIVNTINLWLVSLAQTYLEHRTPVRVKTRHTKYGVDLMALMTEEQTESAAKPDLPLDNDIPF
jgi:hypothetical protein